MGNVDYRWPKLWQPIQGTPDLPVGLLADLGWKDNPFKSDRGEDDSYLEGGGIRHPQWPALMDHRQTFLVSSPGCGQTTMLRHMVHSARHDRAKSASGLIGADDRLLAFCFRGSMLRDARNWQDHHAAIIRMMATALLGFLACNPDVFDAIATNNQLIVCKLLMGHMSNEQIINELQDKGLDSSAARLFAQTVAALGSMGSSRSSLSEPEISQLLWQARLVDFQGYLLAVDISASDLARRETTLLAEDLRPLVRLALDLRPDDIILKIGIPSELAASIEVIPSEHRVELSRWPASILEGMLRERLSGVAGERGGGLEQLFGNDRPARLYEALAQAACGSPRDLMRLGNALLQSFAKVWPNDKLANADLDAVITQVRSPLETTTTLRHKLCRHFNEEELKTLSVDLKVDYDSLPALGKEAKARELIATLERRQRLPDLIALCRRLRPNVTWDLPPAALEPPC